MKKLYSILPILAFCINFCRAQSKGTHIFEFKDKQLVQMITSIDTTIGRTDGNISVLLFRIDNPFGSAHLPGTDEISIKYAVAVGYNDDTPNYKLFNLGDYINPALVSFEIVNKGNFSVTIEHGVYANRKKSSFLVNLKGVTIVNNTE